jgi:hypothetical protein
MPTQSESPVAVSGEPSKTVELLRKWLRRLLRVIVVLAACVAVTATAFAIWWLNSLNGLPDIGDPFDVAAFRASRIADDSGSVLRHAIETWAADPKTTIPQFRRALGVMVECRRRIDWDAYSLKREYLDLMRFLDGPVDPDLEQIERELTYRVGDYQSPTELSVRLHQAKRRLWREPERSRRVVRLLFAN